MYQKYIFQKFQQSIIIIQMQADGTSQKRSYKHQVLQLTEMLDNTLKQLTDIKESHINLQHQVQKFKHTIQEKDVRIKFLQNQVTHVTREYDKIKYAFQQKEEQESINKDKSTRLSRLCNNQLQNELEYLKSQNAGLNQINEEYLRQLDDLRRWKQVQTVEKTKWHEKVICLKKDLERKDEIIMKLTQQLENTMKEKEEKQKQKEYELQYYITKQNQTPQKQGQLKDSKQEEILSPISPKQSITSRNMMLEDQLSYAKQENLNIRNQLSILRQRNDLLQQKYIQLERELQNRISLSKQQSETLCQLIQQNNRLKQQITDKEIESKRMKDESMVNSTKIEIFNQQKFTLENKIQQLEQQLKMNHKGLENKNLQLLINIQDLKQNHRQQIIQIKQKYEQALQQKGSSCNQVKDELIRVQKYLENQYDSPEKVTQLEAQNAKMTQKIRILEEQLAGQDNTFHLSDRTPLVMASETTLSDFDVLYRKQERQKEAKEKMIRQLDLKIADFQNKVEELQDILKIKQQTLQNQKQQLMVISNQNKELVESQQIFQTQLQQLQSTKQQNVQLKYQIEKLNQDMKEVQSKLQMVCIKLQQKMKVKLKQNSDSHKLGQILQYLNDSGKQLNEQSCQTEEPYYNQCIVCESHYSTIQKAIAEKKLLQSQVISLQNLLEVKQKEIVQLSNSLVNNQMKNGEQINQLTDERNEYVAKCEDALKKFQDINKKYLAIIQTRQDSAKDENFIQSGNDQNNLIYKMDYLKKIQQMNEQEQENQYLQKYTRLKEQLQREKQKHLQEKLRFMEEKTQIQNNYKILQSSNEELSNQIVQIESKKQQYLKIKQEIRLFQQTIKQIQQSNTNLKQVNQRNLKQMSDRNQDQRQKIIQQFQEKIQLLRQKQMQLHAQNKQLQLKITLLQTNLKLKEEQIQQKRTIDQIEKKQKQNSNRISQNLQVENSQLKIKIVKLQEQVYQSTVINQKHKHSIFNEATIKSKQKKTIQKLKIQLEGLGKREEFLIQDRKHLKEQLFLAKRELQTTKDDLIFEKKRNNNLQELYQKFRKQKSIQIKKVENTEVTGPVYV